MTKRRPKDIGTADETAVARAFARNGFGQAERRSLKGTKDCGDIVGMLGLMVEVKGGKAAREASDNQIEQWMLHEVTPQTVNARADYGLLVTPRKGIGPTNAEQWWCHFWLSDLILLAAKASKRYLALDWGDLHSTADVIVHLHLSDAAEILRAAGYGDPLEES